MKKLFIFSLAFNLAAIVWILADRSPVAEGGETPPPPALNGDVNCDGIRDLSDAIFLLSWIFRGSEAPCPLTNPELSMQLMECQIELANCRIALALAERN